MSSMPTDVATAARMSMIGLAGIPGTAVLPTCSIATSFSPNAEVIRPASRRYDPGQDSSYSSMWMRAGRYQAPASIVSPPIHKT
jgi:hypothetical protein